MIRYGLLLALALAASAQAEVYRWVDGRGAVHYSNAIPPEGVSASLVGPLARGGFLSGPGFVTSQERARALEEAPPPPERPAEARPRGLDFRSYVALERGMSEGELLGIAGQPDLHSRERSFATYTYLPTAADPYTTTIELVRGRIKDIERVRRF